MTPITKSTIRMKSAKPWLWLEKADNEGTVEEICLLSSWMNAVLEMPVTVADGWQPSLTGQLGRAAWGGTGSYQSPRAQLTDRSAFPTSLQSLRSFYPSIGEGKWRAEVAALSKRGKKYLLRVKRSVISISGVLYSSRNKIEWTHSCQYKATRQLGKPKSAVWGRCLL